MSDEAKVLRFECRECAYLCRIEINIPVRKNIDSNNFRCVIMNKNPIWIRIENDEQLTPEKAKKEPDNSISLRDQVAMRVLPEFINDSTGSLIKDVEIAFTYADKFIELKNS